MTDTEARPAAGGDFTSTEHPTSGGDALTTMRTEFHRLRTGTLDLLRTEVSA